MKLPIVFRFVMFSAVSVVCGATALINENLKIWFGLAQSDDVFTDRTAQCSQKIIMRYGTNNGDDIKLLSAFFFNLEPFFY